MVVAEDRLVKVFCVCQVTAAGAQIVSCGESGVEDVVRVCRAVAIAVRSPACPGGRYELHRPHSAVVIDVAVKTPMVCVGDSGEPFSVERRTEDRRTGGAVGVHPAAPYVIGLDLADGGEEPP